MNVPATNTTPAAAIQGVQAAAHSGDWLRPLETGGIFEICVVPGGRPPRRLARAAAALRRWSALARQAHAINTIKAWTADWRTFTAFCTREGLQALPATPETLERFITDRTAAGRAFASLQRLRSTISKAHTVAGFSDPGAAPTVTLALKAAGKVRPARQKQARGLVWADVAHCLAAIPSTLRDHRDRAFVAVAYDTTCRSAEVVQFDVADFELPETDPGIALIRQSKTDPTGEGREAYLAPSTVQLVRTWLERAGLREGAVFRHIQGKTHLRERLKPPAASQILKRLVLRATFPADVYRTTSGHSTRVGAIQDLVALNQDIPAIQRDTRLKDPRMIVRYSARLQVARGAMARAAKAQGRA